MSPRLLRLGLHLAVLALTAVLATGAYLVLERMHAGARGAAEAGLEQAARAAEAAVNRQFLQIDSTLAGLPAVLRAAAAGRPLSQASANALLRELNTQSLAFRDILLSDPRGDVWAAALPASRQGPLPFEAGHLEQRGRGAGIVVIGPIQNPATAEWSLFFSRPIVVAGVGQLSATIEVPIQLVAGLLAATGDMAQVRVRLQRRSGELLVSVPHDEALMGRDVSDGTRRAAGGLAGDGGSAAGAQPGEAGSMEAVRTTLYQTIEIRVGREAAEALGEWRRDRRRIVFGLVGLVVLLLCLAGTMDLALRARERLEAERVRARALLENAIESMPDGFVMWDAQDRLVTCNRRFRELYAASADALVPGTPFDEVMLFGASRGQYPQCGEDPTAFVRGVQEWRRSDQPVLERLLPDGKWLLVSERRTPDGGFVGIRTDITALKAAMAELSTAHALAEAASAEARLGGARLHAALGNMSQGLCMCDAEGRVIVANRQFVSLLDLPENAADAGTPVGRVFGSATDAASARLVAEIGRRQLALAAGGASGDFVSEHAARAIAVAHRPMVGGGWVATYEDVTERRQAEARIRFLAHHDSLTGLPNRVLFRSHLDEVLQAAEGSGDGVALLLLDLDRFKQVNDTLGHPAGDELLRSAASRLRGCLRDEDFAARLGGDEFAVVHRSAALPGSAERLAQRIMERLGAPYGIAGTSAVVGVSVGIAVAATADPDTVQRNADVALYRAKADGRGTSCTYEPRMGSAVARRLGLEADLREALREDQFRLVYQPLQDLRTGRLRGFEALVRWSHPDLGQVSPAEFIPLAEETGLIIPLGERILAAACRAAAGWPARLRIAINLSPKQLRHPDLAPFLARTLRDTGLDPARLELELTETALLAESEDALGVLRGLRNTGVGIALDDFGTGYSSLRHLTNLPVDRIKMDRSFVHEMTRRPECLAIVTSIASLAKQLGLATTAEGIETAEQLSIVRAAGYEEGQGFLIGKALSFGDADAAAREDGGRIGAPGPGFPETGRRGQQSAAGGVRDRRRAVLDRGA